jgi:hypothetical protein
VEREYWRSGTYKPWSGGNRGVKDLNIYDTVFWKREEWNIYVTVRWKRKSGESDLN